MGRPVARNCSRTSLAFCSRSANGRMSSEMCIAIVVLLLNEMHLFKSPIRVNRFATILDYSFHDCQVSWFDLAGVTKQSLTRSPVSLRYREGTSEIQHPTLLFT